MWLHPRGEQQGSHPAVDVGLAGGRHARLRRLLTDGHSGSLNGVFVLVLLIFAIQVRYDVSRSSQLGIAFGLFLFLAGSAIGGVMVAQGQSVVGVAPGGPGLPVLNWSTTGGDFRVAHFLGIHALQILPIAGWLIDRLKGLPRRAKPTAVVAVSAGYVLLMGFVFMQAMNGVPLVRM
jgi:hypothetical protein